MGLGATYLLHCIRHLLSRLKTFFLVCLVPFGSCPRLTLSPCSNSILEFSCRYCTRYVPSWIHTELYELVTVLTAVCLLPSSATAEHRADVLAELPTVDPRPFF